MTTSTSSTIFVTTRLEGFHRWKHAAGRRSYLASRHRHQFGVRVEIQAAVDNDRIVEFHDLIDFVRGLWPTDGEWGDNSCEVIAHEIAQQVADAFGVARCVVTVDEDGEAGATVEVTR